MKLPKSWFYEGPAEIAVVVDKTTESMVIYFYSGSSSRKRRVAIIMPKEGVAQLLTETARQIPRLADVFAECALIATKGYMGVTKEKTRSRSPKKVGWMARLLKRLTGCGA